MGSYLVTGSSGVLGSRVVSALVDSGSTASVVGLDTTPPKTTIRGLHVVLGGVDGRLSTGLFHDVDVVVHLATSSGPAALLGLLDTAYAAGVRVFVVMSSSAVLGAWPTNEVPMTEAAVLRPNPGFDFAVDLAEQERVLQEWRANHDNVRVVVMRMAMVLGGGLERALVSALGGLDVHQRLDASRPVQYLHIDDAVSALVLAATDELDGIYNVAPKGLLADAHARAVAGVRPLPKLPRRAARAVNDVLWRRRYRSSFRSAEPYLEHPWIVAGDRLQAAGWSPAYTSEEALVDASSPTWWASLPPGRRRALVSGGVSAALPMTMTTVAGVFLLWTRRSRRLRSAVRS